MMREACDLAKSARKRGDHAAQRRHNHEALAHEITMKHLNQAAAKLIFEEKNRVRGRPSVETPLKVVRVDDCLCGASFTPKERLTFTACTSKKRSSTRSRNFSRPLDGQTEWSTSLSVGLFRVLLDVCRSHRL
jgi:hypothetical protein